MMIHPIVALHLLRIGHIGPEEIGHDLRCAGADAHDFRMPVDACEKHRLDLPVGFEHVVGECRNHAIGLANIRCALRLDLRKALLRDGNDVLDHAGDLAPHDLVGKAAGLEVRVTFPHLRHQTSQKRDLLQHVEGQIAGAKPIVDVVRVIGDIIGDRGDLRLEAGIGISSRSWISQ